MNCVLYICGGPRDGKVLMKTPSLPSAVIAAETVLEKMEDDEAIEIKFEDGPVPHFERKGYDND